MRLLGVRQSVLDILQELADAGTLTPEVVLKRASDPESPLHDYFDWDDARAAHQHRLAQARVLIRSVRVDVVVETRTVRIPRYVHAPNAGESTYIETLTLRDTPGRARALMLDELGRVLALLRRANALAAALGVEDEIRELTTRAAGLKQALTAREPGAPGQE